MHILNITDMKKIKKGTPEWNKIFRGKNTKKIYSGDHAITELSVLCKIDKLIEPDTPRIAVIGSHSISTQGMHYCREIISALAKRRKKPVIISCLSLGTGAVVLEEAHCHDLPVVGVLSTHPEDITSNIKGDLIKDLFKKKDCCILSQFEKGTPHNVINSIQKLKTVAVLADLVIVVESKKKGSSIVTAKFASENGVPVLAVPGPPDSDLYAGCNDLIANGDARLLCNFESLTELEFEKPEKRS